MLSRLKTSRGHFALIFVCDYLLATVSMKLSSVRSTQNLNPIITDANHNALVLCLSRLIAGTCCMTQLLPSVITAADTIIDWKSQLVPQVKLAFQVGEWCDHLSRAKNHLLVCRRSCSNGVKWSASSSPWMVRTFSWGLGNRWRLSLLFA